MANSHIGFTLDVRKLANVLAQDPTTRAEMLAGIQEADQAPVKLTSSLGSANLTPGEGQEPTWCSLFPALVQGKDSGDSGLFYRNSSRGGKGDRIQMRLRRQPKQHQAEQPKTPGQVIDQREISTEEAAKLLRRAKQLHEQGVTLPEHIVKLVS